MCQTTGNKKAPTALASGTLFFVHCDKILLLNQFALFWSFTMTQLLEKAFSQASLLPEIQQNMLAKWIIEELLAEKKWDMLFSESEDFLAGLADEALSEYEQGKTQLLNVDALCFRVLQRNLERCLRCCRVQSNLKQNRRICNLKKTPIIPVCNSSGFIQVNRFIR